MTARTASEVSITMAKGLGFTICGFVFLVSFGAVSLQAQTGRPSSHQSCFSVHVRLNKTLVDGPKTITLKTRENETTLALKAGCFDIAPELLKEKIDVFFALPGNKIYLSSISPGFFAGPWDIELADKRFETEITLPKHVRAKDACAVTFHVGEPETIVAMAPCRTQVPLKSMDP